MQKLLIKPTCANTHTAYAFWDWMWTKKDLRKILCKDVSSSRLIMHPKVICTNGDRNTICLCYGQQIQAQHVAPPSMSRVRYCSRQARARSWKQFYDLQFLDSLTPQSPPLPNALTTGFLPTHPCCKDKGTAPTQHITDVSTHRDQRPDNRAKDDGDGDAGFVFRRETDATVHNAVSEMISVKPRFQMSAAGAGWGRDMTEGLCTTINK